MPLIDEPPGGLPVGELDLQSDPWRPDQVVSLLQQLCQLHPGHSWIEAL